MTSFVGYFEESSGSCFTFARISSSSVFQPEIPVYPTIWSASPSTSIISVRLTSFEIARFGGASNETVLLQLLTVVSAKAELPIMLAKARRLSIFFTINIPFYLGEMLKIQYYLGVRLPYGLLPETH